MVLNAVDRDQFGVLQLRPQAPWSRHKHLHCNLSVFLTETERNQNYIWFKLRFWGEFVMRNR